MPDKIVTLQNLKVFKDHLADVAVSGSYDDLKDTPNPASDLEILRLFRTEYTINTSVINGYVVQGSATHIWTEETASVVVAANSEYYLPDSISVTGAQYNYDNKTGIIALSNATGNVEISVVCEGEQPTGLTEFSDDGQQIVTGIQFDTSFDPTSFLQGLTYDGNNMCSLVLGEQSSEEVPVIFAYSAGGIYAIMVDGGDGTVWANQAIEGEISAGWQNLTDGKYTLKMSTPITEVSDITGWNGVFVGAVVGGSSLTPFEVNQYVSGMDVNVEGDTTALDSFLANYVDSQGGVASFGITTEEGYLIIGACKALGGSDPMWNDWALMIQADNEEGDSVIIMYSTQAQDISYQEQTIGTIPAGWSKVVDFQNLTFESISTNQQITFEIVQKVTTCNADFDAINGTYIGAIEGEPPAPELTPFEVGQTITGCVFNISDINVETNRSASIEQMLASLTYVGGDCNIVESIVGEDEQYPIFANDLGNGGYLLWAGDDVLVYSTINDSKHGLSIGYQLDGDTLDFGDSYTITGFDQTPGWNGVLIGAVESEPPTPTGLTPFEVGDSVNQIQFSKTLSNAEIEAFFDGLEDGTLITGNIAGLGDITASQYWSELGGIEIACAKQSAVVFSTSDGEVGWQRSFSETSSGTTVTWDDGLKVATFEGAEVTFVSALPGTNGVLFGKYTGGDYPQLSPFVANESIRGIEIDPTATPTGYNDMDAYLVDVLGNEPVDIDDNAVVEFSTGSIYMGTDQSGDVKYLAIVGAPININGMIVYATDDSTFEGVAVTHGWNIVPNGDKATVFTGRTRLFGNDDFTVQMVVSDFGAINGIILGALDPRSAPSSLTPFENGQTITGFDFGSEAINGQISSDMNAFLNNLPNQQDIPADDGDYYLLPDYEVNNDIFTTLKAFDYGVGNGGFALFAASSGHHDGQAVYSTENGWMNLTDGKWMVGDSITIGSPVDATPATWNGILVGAITGVN